MIHTNKSKLAQQVSIEQLLPKYQHMARFNYYCCLGCRHQHAANTGDASAHFGSKKCLHAQRVRAPMGANYLLRAS